MRKIQNLSLSKIISIPFLVVFLVMIASLLYIRQKTVNEENTVRIQLVSQNKLLAQKIVFLCKEYINNNTLINLQIQGSMQEYATLLNVIRNGGSIQGFNTISPLRGTDTKESLMAIEKQWNISKVYIQTILEEVLYIEKKLEAEVGQTDSTGTREVVSKVIKELNPTVASAMQSLVDQSDAFVLLHDNLIHNLVVSENNNHQAIDIALLVVILLNIIILILAIYNSRSYIVKPIKEVANSVNLLSHGNLRNTLQYHSQNELGQIATSINSLRKNLSQKVDFIKELSLGNYGAAYETGSQNDEMGEMLLEMRESFVKAAQEEEKRKIVDRKQNWAAKGLSEMSDILRQDNDNIEKFSYNIINYLVSYLEANQGAMFVINDNDLTEQFVELTASVAYSKRKFTKKKFAVNEGIIGRSIMEKLTIQMTELPEGYIEITSGLGAATPKYLLIVPLKYNELIFGVLEIASFIVFEQYKTDFVEKIAESIASTISTVKINLKTADLLKNSQEQAQKRARQEELLRKNMADLRLAQEEARLQEEKLASFTDSVNHTMIRAEYDLSGKLIYANTKFLETLGYMSSSDVDGRHITMFIDKKDKEWFKGMWEPLSKGGKHYEGTMKHKTKHGEDLWMMATYTAVRDKMGNATKVLFLGINTTEQKIESLDHKGIIDAVESSNLKIEFHSNGKIIKTNEIFRELIGYSLVELEVKTVFDFIDKKELISFKILWDNAIKEIPFRGEIKLVTQSDEHLWVYGSLTAVKNMYEEVAKVVFIANDITEQKRIELLSLSQKEEIRRNLAQLEEAQKHSQKNQIALEQTNIKLKDNEENLKRALDAARQKEKELQEKNEQIAASEEEIMQNLEMLQNTQEAMQEKQTQLQAIIDAIDTSMIAAEIDLSGTLIRGNNNFFENLNLNKLQSINLKELFAEDIEFGTIWTKATLGQSIKGENKYKLNGLEYWYIITLSPIMDQDENVAKIFMLANDITQTKKLQLEAREQANQLIFAETELRSNLEDLKKTQAAMQAQKEKLEETNLKLNENEKSLKEALMKMKKSEEELQHQAEQLMASEEELIQTMEYMQNTSIEHQQQRENDKKLISELEEELNNSKLKIQELENMLKKL